MAMPDDIAEEWAELYDVEPEYIQALSDVMDIETIDLTREELNDYLQELADEYDFNISDLYDMYYGYEPD